MRLLFLVVCLAAAPAVAKEKIAVMPFAAKSGDGALVSQVLATMLLEIGAMDVVDRGSLTRIFDEKQIQAMSASDEQLLQVASIAAADYLLVGELGMLGSKHVLNVRLLKVADGSVALAKMTSWVEPDRMEGMMRSLAARLSNRKETVAFDPALARNVGQRLARDLCAARNRLRGQVTSNMMGQLHVNLGSQQGMVEGTMLKVLRGGDEIGELELTSVQSRSSEGAFTPSSMAVARVGDLVAPQPLRIAVAEFEVPGEDNDGKSFNRDVMGQMNVTGCSLAKRQPIKNFAGMSAGRRKRLAKNVDAVVGGQVLSRRGRLVVEVQITEPASGRVIRQFSVGL